MARLLRVQRIFTWTTARRVRTVRWNVHLGCARLDQHSVHCVELDSISPKNALSSRIHVKLVALTLQILTIVWLLVACSWTEQTAAWLGGVKRDNVLALVHVRINQILCDVSLCQITDLFTSFSEYSHSVDQPKQTNRCSSYYSWKHYHSSHPCTMFLVVASIYSKEEAT